MKENSLQIAMYALLKHPSTLFNIPALTSLVSFALKEKRRKLRQATLETLAVLGQLSTNDMVLDTCETTLCKMNCDQTDQIIMAIKNRFVSL